MVLHALTRLETASSRAPVDRAKRAAVKVSAYEHIRRNILDSTVSVGTALSEYQLAKEIGVSRTPVREALKRLEHEGLVRTVARRGTFVADLSVRDIVEIYQVRIQLEAFAARVAAERIEPSEVDDLLEELDRAENLVPRGRLEAAREHDRHLHRQIIESTSNVRLARILMTLDDQVHRIRERAMGHAARVPATLIEHRAVLQAIKTRDGAAAEKAMRDHLQAARDNAVQMALAGMTF